MDVIYWTVNWYFTLYKIKILYFDIKKLIICISWL